MKLSKNLLAVIALTAIMTPARSQYVQTRSSGAVIPENPFKAPVAKDRSFSGESTLLLKNSLKDTSGPGRVDWQYIPPRVNKPFPARSFILPAVFVVYGVTALESGMLKGLNRHVKEEIWEDIPHKRVYVDNYLMYAPGLAVYALNAAGVHGAHNFKDRTILYMMSSLFANAIVFPVKSLTHQQRPDASAYNSFPSGHTAEAFASAEFMRMEYKDVSPWYGVAGYAMATTTGILRMYNNKHWFNDVVAGAGIGLASTRLAYWLYPVMQNAFGKGGATKTVVMPTYQSGSFGFSLAHKF